MRTGHRRPGFVAIAEALDADPADFFRERVRELGR